MNEEEILSPEEDAEPIVLATVGAVSSAGVTLIFDGEEEASEKVYRVNAGQLFTAGDRVKICPDSGTYIVEFAIGDPMARYPLPAGGSQGQVLTKSSATDYAVEWTTPASVHGIPSGGSQGQVLTKSSGDDYAVSWTTPASVHGIPSGGSQGQVLTKSSATDYAVSWTTPSASTDRLISGNYKVILSSNTLRPDGTGSYAVALGSSSYPFNGCYINGACYLAASSYGATLSFFGHTPSSRQSVASSATVATLITALKAYGLIS